MGNSLAGIGRVVKIDLTDGVVTEVDGQQTILGSWLEGDKVDT